MNQAAQLPSPGALIDGKYVLDRLLGQGGMGAVFAARHKTLGHQVAIKIMLADAANQEASQRFVNEGRAAAHIQNDHVVRVSDVGTEQGYAYMVLELLEGEDLAQLLERRMRLPVHEAATFVVQALRGVSEAHALGIIHRDLKPANLYLAKRRDGSSIVKILDFGISKAHGAQAQLGASPGQLTSTKAMLGSPLYMSPEQLRSSKSVDTRADIWAMGIILFELVTGQLPFNGENLGELFAAILETEPPNARHHVPDLVPGFEHVIMKCLQKRPENRFQSATELIHALTPFMSAQAGPPMMSTVALGPGVPVSQMTPSSHMMPSPSFPGAAVTPNPAGPGGAPAFGTTTGSGANIPVVKGVTPFGATPDPTRDPRGTMGGPVPGVPTKANKSVIAAAVAGVVGLLAVGGIAVAFTRRDAPPPASSAGLVASSSASSSAHDPTPSASPPPPPPPSETVASASASAPPPAPSASATVKPVALPVSTAKKPPPPVATNTPPPPATTAAPPPRPTSTAFGGFNSR